MKAIKYLLVGAMLTVSHTAVFAQSGYEAQAHAIYNALKDNPTNLAAAKDLLKSYEKTYKKDPKALVALGNVFVGMKNFDKAAYYADLALKKNKNFGAAYVLKGDIEQLKDDGGKAAEWYQNAMTMDPTNPDGYTRYANVYRKNLQMFNDTMEKLKAAVPGYPVEAASGHAFAVISEYQTAYDFFKKANVNTMDADYLYEYVQSAYFTGKADDALEIAKKGISRFAGKDIEKSLLRYGLYSAVDTKKMEDALKFATSMESSGQDLIYNDYQYIGQAYLAQQNYDEAKKRFEKALSLKEDAYRNYQYLSEVYSGLGDEDQAISYAEKYLTLASNVKPSEYTKLANIYAEKAKNGDLDLNLEKAMGVYDKMAERYPSLKPYAALQQGNMAFTLEKEALAESKWLSAYEQYKSKGNLEESDKSYLKTTLRMLGATIWAQKGIDAAKSYLDELVELDPEDSIAKRYLDSKK